MTFLGPDPVGIATPLGLNGGEDIPAIAPNKVNAVKALTTKYGGDNLGAIQKQFGHGVVNSFVKWEMDRAQRGISPTSNDQTMNLLAAAKSKQAQTEAPDNDPFDVVGNIASDVGNIVTGIPKMPVEIAHDILHAPEAIAAIGSGDPNKIANAPLIRMIPGVYTASNLLQGNISELASHPVQTALDVAPFAGKALEIPVGEGTVASKIAESPVGEAFQRAKGAVGRSMPGQLASESFGHMERGVSRLVAGRVADLHAATLPHMAEVFPDQISEMRRADLPVARDLDKAIPDPTVKSQVFQAVEDPAAFGAKTTDDALNTLNLNDQQRGAVNQFRQRRDAWQQYGLDANELTNRVINGQNEVFDAKSAARLDKGQLVVDRASTMTNLRESIMHPDTADISALHDDVTTAVNNPGLSVSTRRNIASGYVHALDAAGYDTGTLLSDVTSAKGANLGGLVDQAKQLPQTGTVRTRQRRGTPALSSPDRWLEQNRQFTPKKLAKAQELMKGRESRTLPARWQPSFQRIKVDKAKGFIEQKFASDDPAVPQLMAEVNNHLYGSLDPEDIAQINKQSLAEVQKLRDAGYQPEFVHHVSPDQERALGSPSITTVVPKAAQYAARANDWTPSVNSLSVSLTHQGLELAKRSVVQQMLPELRDSYGTSMQDARAELLPVAERVAARRGTTVGQEFEKLLRKEYVKFDDGVHGFVAGNARAPKLNDAVFKSDDVLIKRHLARSINMMTSPPAYSRIFDPVLKVFRTAVLPFSPRFQINNIVGGLVSTAIEHPSALLELPKAWDFVRDLRGAEKAFARGEEYTLKASTQKTIEHLDPAVRRDLGGLKYSVEPDTQVRTQFKTAAGRQLHDIGNSAYVHRVGEAASKTIDFSYAMNELGDDMYRMANYFRGSKEAVGKGATLDEAAHAGMALADKVQPRWLEMTPMERSVFRVVFPFYGFMSHLFRFAARFPIDHPWRTATMAAMSRAELQDFGTGLPQSLASAFFLGNPDSEGNVTAITPGAMNPFRDLGDNLTIAGFMSQTNPVIKAALTQLGYDPVSRGPNLYPEVEYDPTTGGFKSRTPNTPSVAGQLVGGLIPQVNILAALTGTSGDFRNLISSNPDAANRMLASSTGIPILWKKYNVNEQAFSAELNRGNQAKAVLADAMRTGDYSQAERYPSLRGTIAAYRKLAAAGKLKPYEYGTAPSLEANNARQAGSQATTQAEVGN